MISDPGTNHVTKPISAGSVAKIGLIVYVLAALLNSSNLVQMANRMPLSSSTRGPALWASKTLNSVSKGLFFSEPGRRVDAFRGVVPPSENGTEFAPVPDPAAAAAEDPTATVPADPTAVDPGVATVPATAAPSTEPPVTAPRAATQADPAKLYIGGDSLVQGWGSVLQRLAQGTGIVSAPAVDYKAATGLSRPDSYDWPGRLIQQMTASRPQIVIVGFGGNDGQGLTLPGRGAVQPGTPEWAAEYGKRVGATMDFLMRDGRKVIWVGTPMPENATDFAHQAIINQIYRDEVAKRAKITLVDTWTLFESPEHTYAAYMIDEVDGKPKLMRQSDGFHLSIPGAERLARFIFAELQKELQARAAG